MNPDDFLRQYEIALATQDRERVESLMHPDVCVTFNDGTYRGKSAVEQTFRRTFSLIKNERYTISALHWVSRDENYAVHDFHWSGEIDGRPASGGGRGTSVLKREAGAWLLLAEHLGPHAKGTIPGKRLSNC
jgi:ketosteroid isomerase-like protein